MASARHANCSDPECPACEALAEDHADPEGWDGDWHTAQDAEEHYMDRMGGSR